MFKKMLSVLVIATLIFTLTGCIDETKSDSDILFEIKASLLIDATDLTSDITIPTVDNEDVTVTWTSSKPEYLDTDGTIVSPDYKVGDQTVTLTVVLELNDALVTKYFELTVPSLEKPDLIELNTDYTDALTMDFTYENLSFLTDGVGEVTLDRCIDGDTAWFKEGSNSYSVRFLGIDTPESTYKFDPWGKAASIFTCEKLESATTIVLEWDTGAVTRTDSNDRYLAWVWYDGRLINLELVEEAYTGSKGVVGTKYESIFYAADFKSIDSERRVRGEEDPDYDYDLEGVKISIEELVTHPDLFVEKTVIIRGIISRTIGQDPYIQDGDYGIFLFSGFDFTFKLQEGNEVEIKGLKPTYHPDIETGGLQLTDFLTDNADVLSGGNEIIPVVKTISELETEDIGRLVKIMNLTVLSVYNNPDDEAFTITAEDDLGNITTVRRDNGIIDDITADLFTIGTTFDIVAPLNRYNSKLQLMIVHLDDVTFK